MRLFHNTLLGMLLILPAVCFGDPDVDLLLSRDEAPVGVVFEIVEGDDDALAWALPLVRQYSEQLRARFAGLSIVVVTHGAEQFGLLQKEADGPLASIHADARDLRENAVDIHVCGAHAGWYGHLPEDYPSYVDVSPSGPAQINDYRSLGFEVIRLQRTPRVRRGHRSADPVQSSFVRFLLPEPPASSRHKNPAEAGPKKLLG